MYIWHMYIVWNTTVLLCACHQDIDTGQEEEKNQLTPYSYVLLPCTPTLRSQKYHSFMFLLIEYESGVKYKGYEHMKDLICTFRMPDKLIIYWR